MALDPVQVEELLGFMAPSARIDIRTMAMQYFLGLTGSEDGRAFLQDKERYLEAIVELMKDSSESISKDVYLALVNLSTDAATAEKLLTLPGHPNFLTDLLTYITEAESPHANVACTIASNITRSERCAQFVVDLMMREDKLVGFERLVFVFCQKDFNKRKCKLDYLGPFFSNITQIRSARYCIMDKRRCVLQRLLPFVEYEDSIIRRGGVIGALHNCCFETSYHDWLLSEDIDILPRLLLPLAGPEEFDDDDMEKLPADLQYLEPDKKREPDPDIRKMLIETVNQLCATQKCRKYIKDKNTYVILRELFHWEKDPAVKLALDDPIQLMIGDEPEPGMENLNEIEIPDDLTEKLEKARLVAHKEVEEEIMEMKKASEAADTPKDES